MPHPHEILEALASGPRPVVDLASGLTTSEDRMVARLGLMVDEGLVLTHTNRHGTECASLTPRGRVELWRRRTGNAWTSRLP
jgi:hypothetical protein